MKGLNLSPYTWLIAFINLIIYYFLMKKFLFKPITKFMDKRTQSIKDSIDNAEKSKADAAALKQQYEDKLHEARVEADKILNDARIRANKEYEETVAHAMQRADTVIEDARKETEREREQMIKDLKSQFAGVALTAASKVIEANMDTEANRKIVDKFIDEVGAA